MACTFSNSNCSHFPETNMTVTVSLNEFSSSSGRQLEPSDWLLIDQDRVNQFASATNDHQFIHTDPERAAQTQFGGTIAHGFLTLSMLSHLNGQNMITPEGLVMGINYGSNKIRYLQPVLVGDRIRTRQKLLEISQKLPGQWMVKSSVVVEIEHKVKAAMVAETLALYIVEK
jgi:acyl dehydratase